MQALSKTVMGCSNIWPRFKTIHKTTMAQRLKEVVMTISDDPFTWFRGPVKAHRVVSHATYVTICSLLRCLQMTFCNLESICYFECDSGPKTLSLLSRLSPTNHSHGALIVTGITTCHKIRIYIHFSTAPRYSSRRGPDVATPWSRWAARVIIAPNYIVWRYSHLPE